MKRRGGAHRTAIVNGNAGKAAMTTNNKQCINFISMQFVCLFGCALHEKDNKFECRLVRLENIRRGGECNAEC